MPKDTPAAGETPRRSGEKPVMDAEAIRDEVGLRCATFLRERYSVPRAKRIARDLGCAPDTAKDYLSGACPQNKHLFVMMRLFGPQFAMTVLEPAVDWPGPLVMAMRLDELRDRADALARELDELRAGRTVPPADGSEDPASYPDENPPPSPR